MKNLLILILIGIFFPPFDVFAGISSNTFQNKVNIDIKGNYNVEDSSIEFCVTDKKHEHFQSNCNVEHFDLFLENIDLNQFYNNAHILRSTAEMKALLGQKVFSKTLSDYNQWDFNNFDYVILFVNYVSNEFIDKDQLIKGKSGISFSYEKWRSAKEALCPCSWSQLFVIKLKKI